MILESNRAYSKGLFRIGIPLYVFMNIYRTNIFTKEAVVVFVEILTKGLKTMKQEVDMPPEQ